LWIFQFSKTLAKIRNKPEVATSECRHLFALEQGERASWMNIRLLTENVWKCRFWAKKQALGSPVQALIFRKRHIPIENRFEKTFKKLRPHLNLNGKEVSLT
jgi:hypothetical protein